MKEQSLEDILTAIRLTEAISQLSAGELETSVERKAKMISNRLAQAKARKDGRAAAGKRRARLNYQKRWMRAKRMKLLEGIPKEGWHSYLMTCRRQWKITREEWEEHVAPLLGDEWISVHRYDGKEPYTLDNIYVQDESTTVFDGKEWKLKQEGFTIGS